MAQNLELKATARPRAGKGASHAVRRAGKVPGVVYGDGKAPMTVAVDADELGMTIGKGKFLARLVELDIDGAKTRVLPREVQRDPVKDNPIHIDFLRIGPGARIRVWVPCKFVNEGASPGLRRGGVLNVVRHEVEVYCPAENIPDVFEFDLTGLEIGRSVHISATRLPEGVKTLIQGRDFTVATIAGAVAEEKEPTAAAAATAEGAPAEGAAAAPAAGDAKAAPAAAGKDAKDAKAPAAGAKDTKAAAAAKPAAGKK